MLHAPAVAPQFAGLVLRATERVLTPGAETATAEVDLAWLGAALEREAPVLLAAARALTLDEAEAHDLVQTTFELAIRHRRSLRDRAAIRAWLLTIQTREAFRIVRKLRRLVPLDPRVADISTGPVRDAEAIAVREALRVLPPRTRAAVVLHHMAGLPVAEVATALRVSPNTVKTQLREGLARLRTELRDE